MTRYLSSSKSSLELGVKLRLNIPGCTQTQKENLHSITGLLSLHSKFPEIAYIETKGV